MGDLKESKRASILYSKNGGKSLDEKLLEPYIYLKSLPGKNIRSRMVKKAMNFWLNLSEEKLELVDDIVRTVHETSLMLDDIADNSTIRRGKPAAHTVYGIPITINAASYISLILVEKVMEFDDPETLKVVFEQGIAAIEGQAMDIYWRDTFTCPTEEEYIEMVTKKASSMFILSVQLMKLFSKTKFEFTKLAELFGISFQIIDDYNNLKSDVYFKSKGFCEDLTEGKFSFPIIHAIRSRPDDQRIMRILRQRTTNPEVKELVLSLLEEFGSFEYTKSRLREIRAEVKVELAKLEYNPLAEEFFLSKFKEVIE